MNDSVHWGILSTGNIAHSFATGLKSAKGAKLIAVGSRNEESAESFGQEFDVPHRHASYGDLADDPDVDAIYIGTPHNFHMENTLLCLEAGKAVLCEKPFAMNLSESRRMVEVARSKKLFLMEAMWTRFFPLMTKVRELVAEGALGEVRMVSADFGFRADWDPKSRLLDPAFGGGSLLDVGIYPLSFASMLMGKPMKISAMAHLGETGVDEEAAVLLGYENGAMAALHSALRTETPQEATVMGTKGQLRIHSRFWCPDKMTLTLEGKEPEAFDIPFEGNGYNYEADEVMACLRAGKLESDVMPLEETLELMETLDAIREQWGLKYPMERSETLGI